MRHVLTAVGVISTLYALGLNLSYVILWPFARTGITQHMRARHWAWFEEAFTSPMTPGISIVVPAFNEQRVVLESIRSLIGQRYPRFEVVLVDDGSTDATAALVIDAHGLVQVPRAPRGGLRYAPVHEVWQATGTNEITVVRKANGGRADALNCGIDHARHPFVCVTDADTILDPGALMMMVRPFLEDPGRVVAVGGTVRVANSCRIEGGRLLEARVPAGMMAGCQLIEYLRAFLLGRTGWDRLGAVMIVSGAFGLFPRELLQRVGGYCVETVGEDLELTLRLHHHMRDLGRPYRIVYNPDPVCWTEVPADARSLGRQRRRWHRGLWQSLWSHRDMMLRPRYGLVGVVGLPYMLVFEFLGPVFVTAAWISFPIGLALRMIDPQLVLGWIVCQAVFGTLVTLAACSLEERGFRYYSGARDLGRMLMLAVLENIAFRQLVDCYRLMGMVDLVRRKQGWGTMKRQGFGRTG